MIFNTTYNRTPQEGETNKGKILVEKAGYIPAKKRIENMMLAGQRLKDYRAATYDFPDGNIDFKLNDPTRSPNFDLADATQLSLKAEQNIIESKRAMEALQKQQEALQKQQEASEEALKVKNDVKDDINKNSPE